MRTYDIINAGPKNRFMCDGVIVSNSGRIFQPQNLARPDMKNDAIEEAIVALKSGKEPEVETMRAVGNAVRGSIIAPPGRKLVIADLSNIEGRVLAWLAGEQWKLDAFSEFDAGRGEDLYKVAYGRSFGVPPEEATGDKRQIGKVMELGLGYQGGVSAFLTFAMVYKMDLDAMATSVRATAPDEDARGVWRWAVKNNRTHNLSEDVYVACEILKAGWRRAHTMVVSLWTGVEDAFRQAMFAHGAIIRYRDLAFRREGRYLKIRLPSGRVLYYRDPEVDMKGKLSYMGVNQFTRQWSRITTYGGKLVENCTQATARDVMTANMQRINDSGYEIVLSVHDELLTETPDAPEYNAGTLASMMATIPPWATGLPLAAAGFETYRYRKG